MKLAVLFGIALLSLASGAPTSDDDTIVITTEIFRDEFVVYTGQHPIVKMKLEALIGMALLSLATCAPTSNDATIVVTSEYFNDTFAVYTGQHSIISMTFFPSENKKILFFVEADINEKGGYDYKGLYTLKMNGNATKILGTGTDAAVHYTNTSFVYLSATDGLYTYNAETEVVEKYGTVTDSLIGVVKLKSNDELYVLTADHVVYKISENGEKKVKIDAIQGAQKIISDFSDHLYYYGEDKQPYVLTGDGAKKIEGLPANPNSVSLTKPPYTLRHGVVFESDGKCYFIYNDGTSEESEFELQLKPTASALERLFVEYLAYNKKIYEYNVIAILSGLTTSAYEKLKSFLEGKTEDIQSIATHSQGTLKV